MSAAISAEDIKVILAIRDDEDVKAVMLLNLASGLSLHKSIRHARSSCARDRLWNGVTPPRKSRAEKKAGEKTLAPCFVYMDHAKQVDDSDGCDLHETIEAEDPVGLMDMRRSVSAVFQDSIEAGLDFIGEGTAEIALVIGLSQRRVQQIIVEQVEFLNQHGSLLNIEQRVETVLAALRIPANVYGKAEYEWDDGYEQSGLVAEGETA